MKYGIIFGGRSYEHEISIVSAIALKEKLPTASFIFLDQEHNFYLIESDQLRSSLFTKGEYKRFPRLELGKGGFYRRGLFREKRVPFDVAINLIHGADGEDGKMAALLMFHGIPFIGPRIEGSVMSYNKLFTKLYAKGIGCDVIEYQLLKREKIEPIQFDYPIIIKPLRLGSSIGVSVVRQESELSYALDVAFEFDDEVLIEPFFQGIEEYNLAGCRGSGFLFSKLERVEKRDFLDFDKKYKDFRQEKVEEAQLPAALSERIKECFVKVYEPLFLGAIIRIDFFVHRDRVYINEINPVPGSLAHYLFDNFRSVLDELARNLPKERPISVDYRYLNSISAKK
ncbi:MAG: D-alanine--D-alanine ligase [Epsilonproteobacteria bacterium]|nr:D-alanine--D-alanine ligase [Campylobacterota bacterium]NPA56606.1 D-alanine--D-alanine ligase [Campylobacterota bacterium]